VSEDKLVAVDTKLGKIISPIERIFGITALGVSTANEFATFGQVNGNGNAGP
jgi:hypothetical protein